MAEEQRWTIGDLADLAGVTPRTIRYYNAEGLLPPPESRGKYALYTREHLQRLRLIARLKAAYLPLSEIRERLNQLSPEQMTQLLEGAEAPRAAAAETAADYVAQILHPPIVPLDPPRPIGYKPAISGTAHKLQARASLVDAADVEQSTPGSPPHLHPPRGSILSYLAPEHPAEAGVHPHAEQHETWQRLALAPGVELHLRQPLPPEIEERTVRLVEAARRLFETDD